VATGRETTERAFWLRWTVAFAFGVALLAWICSCTGKGITP
jgi:hypothetical protein